MRRSSRPLPPTGCGGRRRWAFLVAIVALGPVLASDASVGPLLAQEDNGANINREYQIKAAYLYQFGRYVQWPPEAFPSPQTPFVIGVMEKDAIAGDLDEIAQAKKIDDRTIEVRRFSSPKDVRACHILFLSASLTPEEQAEIIHRVSRRGALLAGEDGGFIDRGGVVQFNIEGNTVRINIPEKRPHAKALQSPKLLQVAHVVD